MKTKRFILKPLIAAALLCTGAAQAAGPANAGLFGVVNGVTGTVNGTLGALAGGGRPSNVTASSRLGASMLSSSSRRGARARAGLVGGLVVGHGEGAAEGDVT